MTLLQSEWKGIYIPEPEGRTRKDANLELHPEGNRTSVHLVQQRCPMGQPRGTAPLHSGPIEASRWSLRAVSYRAYSSNPNEEWPRPMSKTSQFWKVQLARQTNLCQESITHRFLEQEPWVQGEPQIIDQLSLGKCHSIQIQWQNIIWAWRTKTQSCSII